MAANINRVIVTGNLTRDPELRALQSGDSVCELRIAVNERVKNSQTGNYEDRANYFNVTVWSPREIGGIPSSTLDHLLNAGSQEWSGFALRIGARHLVVANTAQSERRQNSVLMQRALGEN